MPTTGHSSGLPSLSYTSSISIAELGAALDALLGNVCRYTPQGAPFEVTVSRRDGYVAIRVEDGGPGIANPDKALRRGMSMEGSTGLGLDIVRRVAVGAVTGLALDRAHGAREGLLAVERVAVQEVDDALQATHGRAADDGSVFTRLSVPRPRRSSDR